MKKILLGTTTLIGAAALFAGAANAAETPKVTIGGVSDFQVGMVDEDLDTGLRSGAFRTETEISVKIDAKTDAGLGYGGQIDLDVSNTDNQDDADDQVGKSFLYVEGAWGRLEGGSNVGVSNTLKVDASTIARATGGIDGDFHYFLNTTNTVDAKVIGTPDLLLDYGYSSTAQFGDEGQESINKVSYYTPRYMGFQAGVSYLFDSNGANRGTGVVRTDADAGQAEGIFLAGLNYEGKFDQFTLAASATGEFGDAETAATEDLSSYAFGASVGFMGFTVAGSYGTWDDSLATAPGLDDRDFWTLGAAYEFGPFGVSVTYLDSTYEVAAGDNDFSNLSVGVDYKLAPGFTPYAEVSFVDVDTADVATRNDGTVFIAGTQLAF